VIVDAHHHLWQRSRGDYHWLDSRANPALAPIDRDYLLHDYHPLTAAHAVSGSVAVQAAESVAETRWLLQQARAAGGLIQGVVGWVDMTSASAPKVLAELAQDRLLRAIRPMLQDIADVDWVLQPRLDAAFRAIIELDLAFDLLIRPPHLASALTLLMRYPELRAIVDHCAKPDIARGAWQPWADGMRRVAKETSAFCKLSGLVTEARPDWKIDHLRPYVEHVIECFGPPRLVWGSDWPVMMLNADYGRWLDTAQELIAPLSESDRRAVMGLNAMRFYRLDSARST